MDKENRVVVRSVLNIAEDIAKHTKNGLDDAAITSIATYFQHETKNLPHKQVKAVAKKLTETSSGPAKEIQFGVNTKGVAVQTPYGAVTYNPKNGSLKYSKTVKI